MTFKCNQNSLIKQSYSYNVYVKADIFTVLTRIGSN